MDRLIRAIVDFYYYAQQLLGAGLYWVLYPYTRIPDLVPEALREFLTPSEDFTVSDETMNWAHVLAEWAGNCSKVNVFLYGSRVRGDHHPTSDLNVYVDLQQIAGNSELDWWRGRQKACSEEFKKRFGLELRWLDGTDPIIAMRLKRSLIVHRDGNVFCMWMPPKRKPIFRFELGKRPPAS